MTQFSDLWTRTLERLRRRDVISRIWARDHTVWRDDPTEIADRLGWLEVPRTMARESRRFTELADTAEREGIRDVVLLGMGGSSLGAEALARVCASEIRRPLHVLDSTVPGQVRSVRDRIDLSRTCFVVSSKSGTTAETLALRDYFWSLVDREDIAARGRFVTVTDPGTPLAAWGHDHAVSRTFLNPADIGGRFSVLSFFGLVPAALAGVDVAALLARAGTARESTAPDVALERNPAARLGSYLAAGVEAGRDKLTLLTSPGLESFGLWAEQLLAESTGKSGTGILPVAEEPPFAPERYGADRLFVALSGSGDAALGHAVEALQRAGHPVIERAIEAPAEIGREMFVWELATAVAGHLLEIHPFDQPNVQSAKSRTETLLEAVEGGEDLPAVDADDDLPAALSEAPDYVAFLAFLPSSEALEDAMRNLRAAVTERTGAATTFGYGPRYLHSTGQLHKGGPAGGLFVQLVDGEEDLEIPGRSYGFRTLARAQADGDLRALEDAGRRVVRVEVAGNPVEAVRGLVEEVSRS